ncbi:hypothetical protein SB861_37875 [Paraburkholderia sp. SIMBA_049]
MGITALKYAGIGPRQTPSDVCMMMANVGAQLDSQGWMIRSGHAQGADQAWACRHRPQMREIYLPWNRFNNGGGEGFHVSPNTDALVTVARVTHPGWDRLSDGSRKLMMRNVSIILGPELNDPVKFVAYWAEQRTAQGGTGNAVRLASLYGIPSFNIAFGDEQQAMSTFVDTFKQACL